MSEPFLAEIKIFGGNFAPRGYATCSGQILSIAQNTALFSLLGTTYGGNGQTTFGLPDLRSRAAVGAAIVPNPPGLNGFTLGQVGGVQSTTLLITNMPAHTHALTGTLTVATTVSTNSSNGTKANPSGNIVAKGIDLTTSALMANFTDAGSDGGSLGGVTSAVTNNLLIGAAGGTQPFSILSPFVALNYILATEGIFPSRN